MLDLLLPSEGLYCVAIQLPHGGFSHKWWSSIEAAHTNALAIDATGQTVYIAQSSFTTSDSRKQSNVHRVRSFWFDIDCGAEKFEQDPAHSYATQMDAAAAFRVFLADTGLPAPAIVNSGNGLYAHWPLTTDILYDQWKATADILKKVSHAYNFKSDDSRTSDASSVLRPIGSHNRKHGNCKPVHTVRECEPIDYTHFASLVRRAADAKKIDTAQLSAPTAYSGLNDEFVSGIGEGPPSSLLEVANHCAQMAAIRDKLGNVSEPLWYAVLIGIGRHCLEGESGIQDWSIGHPDYSPDSTRAKIAQHTFPPTTCEHIGNINPSGCVGCRYNGKIKTPITLGRRIEKLAVAEMDEERIEPPCGFSVTKDGIFYDADTLRIYPYDIFPTLLAWDDSLGYETITFRHSTPHNGWKSFAMRTGALQDKKICSLTLCDNHVQLTGNEERKLMMNYLEQYASKLRAKRALTKLYAQMGWRDEDGELCFILGGFRYTKGKEPEPVGFAKNVPEVAKSFKTQGSLAEWVGMTDIFGATGMVPHYFPFLAGTFGSLLLKFTGYEGALISCVGDSGTGKTLLARMIQSAYGEPGRLMMLRDDTKNSLVARLGVYGSLPVTIDEVTNIDAMELSDLVYRITQGRDKARLSRNGSERNILNHWNTIAVTSSNSSLIEKLSSVKSDASAEINRVMEIYINANDALDRESATEIYRTINQNFGVAGPIFVQYIVDHMDEHRDQIDRISAMIVDKAGCKTEERFQVAVAACTLYGGVIAHKLGLVKHGMQMVTPWIIEHLQGMQSTKKEVVSDSISILGNFLTRHALNGIVVGASNAQHTMHDVRGQIVFRYEIEAGKCFISRDFLRTELTRQHTDFAKLRADLREAGVLLNADKRKTLTAGIAEYPGAQQLCWELDMRHPSLGSVAARIVPPNKITSLRSVGA